MSDDIGGIIGMVVTWIVVVIFAIAMFNVLSSLGDQQCQPYKDTISQKDRNIQSLNTQLTQTQGSLDQCKNDYDTLIRENITKKDFEEIKGYYNITQIQIQNLEQRIEQSNLLILREKTK